VIKLEREYAMCEAAGYRPNDSSLFMTDGGFCSGSLFGEMLVLVCLWSESIGVFRHRQWKWRHSFGGQHRVQGLASHTCMLSEVWELWKD
jgi:hypothetical protein